MPFEIYIQTQNRAQPNSLCSLVRVPVVIEPQLPVLTVLAHEEGVPWCQTASGDALVEAGPYLLLAASLPSVLTTFHSRS